LRDHPEGDDAGDHEDQGLEDIGPDGAAEAAEKHIEQHNGADRETTQFGRDAAGERVQVAVWQVAREEVGKHPLGRGLDEFAGGNDANQQVRDQ